MNLNKVQIFSSQDARNAATAFGCGQCMNCRINKGREWSTRILLESMSYASSTFCTLTYSDENLPPNNSLSKKDIQSFLKKLRKQLHPRLIRYFAVGEYGDRTNRPHYHLILFNTSELDHPSIKKGWSFRSEELGHIQVGVFSEQAARYVTGYTLKKLTSKNHPDLPSTECEPEFAIQSKMKGGLGIFTVKRIAKNLKYQTWWKKNKQIVREIRIGGKKYPLGRYLTEAMNKELGITEEEIQESLIKNQADKFLVYRVGNSQYYNNIVDLNEGNRLKQEKRHKIFSSKRSI